MPPDQKLVSIVFVVVEVENWLTVSFTTSRLHPVGGAGNTIMENNGGLPSGQVPKPRTSTGGKEDTENSSMGSPLEMFEGFDS